jgi:hypothetical protein
MSKRRRQTLVILALSLVATGISALYGVKFWWAFAILAAAILVNGLIASIEDDLPGGFNNPDGSATPKFVVAAGWGVRILGLLLLVLCVVALALFKWG